METMQYDYDTELKRLDEKIKELRKQINSLIGQQHKLLAKIQHVDMDIVLQCIIEKGLSSSEVLALLNNERNEN